jgi:hypothetical protein
MEAIRVHRIISHNKFLAEMFNGSYMVVTCREPDKYSKKHGEVDQLIFVSFPFGHSKYEYQ